MIRELGNEGILMSIVVKSMETHPSNVNVESFAGSSDQGEL
jgi:hypothetical protein